MAVHNYTYKNDRKGSGRQGASFICVFEILYKKPQKSRNYCCLLNQKIYYRRKKSWQWNEKRETDKKKNCRLWWEVRLLEIVKMCKIHKLQVKTKWYSLNPLGNDKSFSLFSQCIYSNVHINSCVRKRIVKSGKRGKVWFVVCSGPAGTNNNFIFIASVVTM